MIQVTPAISIDESELSLEFVRASGPGGQNVNKVATAVRLHFDAARSPSISDDIRERLLALAGRRATRAGVIVIRAGRHRTQERNRADAIARLVALIAAAAVVPRSRKATKPTRASRDRRLEGKRRRSLAKRTRGNVRGEGD